MRKNQQSKILKTNTKEGARRDVIHHITTDVCVTFDMK